MVANNNKHIRRRLDCAPENIHTHVAALDGRSVIGIYLSTAHNLLLVLLNCMCKQHNFR